METLERERGGKVRRRDGVRRGLDSNPIQHQHVGSYFNPLDHLVSARAECSLSNIRDTLLAVHHSDKKHKSSSSERLVKAQLGVYILTEDLGLGQGALLQMINAKTQCEDRL